MTTPTITTKDCDRDASDLAELLYDLPQGRRGALLQIVATFEPSPTVEESFELGPLRAAFADYWESFTGKPVPISSLRLILWSPVRMETASAFHRFVTKRTAADIDSILPELFGHLVQRIDQVWVASEARVGSVSSAVQAGPSASDKVVPRSPNSSPVNGQDKPDTPANEAKRASACRGNAKSGRRSTGRRKANAQSTRAHKTKA